MNIKNTFKNMTIKRRFTISAIAVVIITMFIFTIIRIIALRVDLEDEINQKIETTSRLTTISFVDPIWNLNKESIKEISNALFQDKEIGYISVKGEGCDEIYNQSNKNKAYDNQNLIVKKVEVVKDDLKIGEVTIGITNYFRMQKLKEDILTTIISILIMIFILWSAFDVVSRFVTKSIYALSDGTDEISNGNLSHRLPIDSSDEIGELAKKFNRMTKKLEDMVRLRDEADKALQQAHFELENKVIERTKQLQEALIELEKQHIELKSTQSKLVQWEKMASIGILVAGVAHEINNPINYTYLSTKVLEDDLRNFKEDLIHLVDEINSEVIQFFEGYFKKFSASINTILDGSNQIKTIVQDLRLFSRLDDVEKKETSISNLLEKVIRLVKVQYSKQIEFDVNINIDKTIECYPTQLNQVFLNIIVNACQAIIKRQNDLKDAIKGVVRINLSDNHQGIMITIGDNGCGMSEDVKSKIFEPFFTTKPIGQGTGMGMSISYGIIEKHNGSIEVESQEGKGTVITIFLPYKVS
ncbi:MAG: ATP-binding protein [Clostridiaceae bacterium]